MRNTVSSCHMYKGIEVEMKKFLALLIVIFTASTQSYAYITTEDTSSEEYIQNHGHSDEMSRLIDLQHAQINGTKTNYVAPAKWHDKWTDKKSIKLVRKVFMYFDPGLDDGLFMQHNIDYANRYDDL